MPEDTIVESQPPVNHEVLIDASKLNGDLNTFPCTLCGETIYLLYTQGQGFSLRDEDAANSLMGAIKIEYVNGIAPS
jgi:hypothetical protein